METANRRRQLVETNAAALIRWQQARAGEVCAALNTCLILSPLSRYCKLDQGSCTPRTTAEPEHVSQPAGERTLQVEEIIIVCTPIHTHTLELL